MQYPTELPKPWIRVSLSDTRPCGMLLALMIQLESRLCCATSVSCRQWHNLELTMQNVWTELWLIIGCIKMCNQSFIVVEEWLLQRRLSSQISGSSCLLEKACKPASKTSKRCQAIQKHNYTPEAKTSYTFMWQR